MSDGNPVTTDPTASTAPVNTTSQEPSTGGDGNTTQTPTAEDLFANQLAGIKAEDGRQKYADVSTALNSIPHAQDKIKGLQEELENTKAELAKKQGIEEMLERLNQSQQTPAESTNPAPVQGLNEDAARALVESTLERKEQEKVAKTNVSTVFDKLKEVYGDKAQEMYKQKAQELGVSVEELTQLSSRSPKAVLTYFDSKASADTSTPATPSTVNTSGMKPKEDGFDYMSIFTSGDSPLVKKWRQAAKN